jgi:type II secretory pathway component PulJ
MGAHQATGDKQEQGFALVETIVALAIMALVGLMAWRGMDAMIRGRETIDRRANLDANYFQLVRQFERDCQESLRRDEIAPLFSAASTGGASSSAGNTPAISSLAAGAKNIWWIRRYRADNQDAWMIVGYAMAPSGLQRLTSRPLLRRSEAGTLWASISRDPDLISTELLVSVEVPTIVRQAFQVQAAVIGGASASGSAPLSNATPDTQGVSMQWWVQDQALPLSRSCLMGGAL